MVFLKLMVSLNENVIIFNKKREYTKLNMRKTEAILKFWLAD